MTLDKAINQYDKEIAKLVRRKINDYLCKHATLTQLIKIANELNIKF